MCKCFSLRRVFLRPFFLMHFYLSIFLNKDLFYSSFFLSLRFVRKSAVLLSSCVSLCVLLRVIVCVYSSYTHICPLPSRSGFFGSNVSQFVLNFHSGVNIQGNLRPLHPRTGISINIHIVKVTVLTSSADWMIYWQSWNAVCQGNCTSAPFTNKKISP